MAWRSITLWYKYNFHWNQVSHKRDHHIIMVKEALFFTSGRISCVPIRNLTYSTCCDIRLVSYVCPYTTDNDNYSSSNTSLVHSLKKNHAGKGPPVRWTVRKKPYSNTTAKFVLSLTRVYSVCVINELVNKMLSKGTSFISFCSTVYVTHTCKAE